MESSGAVYAKVPAGGVPALEAALGRAAAGRSSAFPGVIAHDPGGAFALVDRWGKSDDLPGWAEGPDLAMAAELAALAREVGEVVAFYEIDDGASLGVYGAWRDGELVRGLVWSDGVWDTVVGEPQLWERPLFAGTALADALDDASVDGFDEVPVRAAFAVGHLGPGATAPAPRAMAAKIRAALGAPAHGFLPWPLRRDLLARR